MGENELTVLYILSGRRFSFLLGRADFSTTILKRDILHFLLRLLHASCFLMNIYGKKHDISHFLFMQIIIVRRFP